MNLKGLIEERNKKVAELRAIIEAAEKETRGLSEEENKKFEKVEGEIRSLDEAIEKAKKTEELLRGEQKPGKGENEEIREFEEFVRGKLEMRDATNLTKGDNGAVIPKTIANRIIETVKELSPIYALCDKYDVHGTLSIPVWGDNGSDNITCAYASDFTALTSHSGKFTNVELTGFLAGALTKIGDTLIGNADFDITSFIVRKTAESIAEFLEKELIVGTTNKMTGILAATSALTAASATAITADEIIDLEMSIPEVYSRNACFIMHKSTMAALRKLKNTNGDYLLQRNFAEGKGWEILGHRVYVSENMPTMAAGKKPIVFGDMTGLCCKTNGGIELKVLRERFADEHATGVIGWIEADSKIVNSQKLRLITMKAS